MKQNKIPTNEIEARKIEVDIIKAYNEKLHSLEEELDYIKRILKQRILMKKYFKMSKWQLFRFIINENIFNILSYKNKTREIAKKFWMAKFGIRLCKEGIIELESNPIGVLIRKYKNDHLE